MTKELKQEFKFHEKVINQKQIQKAMERVTETIEIMKNPAIMMEKKIHTNQPIKL